MKITYFILSLISLCLILNCARTVTTDEDILTLDLTITLNEPIDTEKNIYIIAFSPTQNIQPRNPAIGYYYMFPGKSFDSNNSQLTANTDDNEKDIQNYYQSTYSTWEQFIYISHNTIDHTSYTSGPQTNKPYFEKTTTDNFTYKESKGFEITSSITNTEIKLTLNIEQLNFEANNTSYFSIFIYEKDSISDSGNIQGFLVTAPEIKIQKHEEKTSPLISGSKIKKWHYKVY